MPPGLNGFARNLKAWMIPGSVNGRGCQDEERAPDDERQRARRKFVD